MYALWFTLVAIWSPKLGEATVNELFRGESPLAMKRTGNIFPLLIFLVYLEKPWESHFELISQRSLFLPHLVLIFLMNSLTFFKYLLCASLM